MADQGTGGFSVDERAAMKERATELVAEKGGRKAAAGLEALLKKVAKMPDGDRAVAERIHAIVTAVAPGLQPKVWYGQPSYTDEAGEIVVFFQAASKFKTRYSTLGFQEAAKLDDGGMWSTSYAIARLGTAEEAKIAELVTKAVG